MEHSSYFHFTKLTGLQRRTGIRIAKIDCSLEEAMPTTVIRWMTIDLECAACKKASRIVLGTKTKEEKPLGKCPLCKSDQIKTLSVTPSEGTK